MGTEPERRSDRQEAPQPIMVVLDDAIDCLLFGSGGVFAIPAGGYIESRWLTKKGCYRLTLDVKIMPPERRAEPEGIGARRIVALEKKRSK